MAAVPGAPATEPPTIPGFPTAERAAAPSAQGSGPVLHTPPLALTPAEYNNTIADLLGFPRDSDEWPERTALAERLSPRRAASKGVFLPPPPPPPWPWRFPAEPGADGFEGIVQGQNPSSYQVEELHLAAMHFASYALVSPTFFACEGWAELPAAERADCAWASIDRFARRAYRRPLRAGERERLAGFWEANRGAGPLDEAGGAHRRRRPAVSSVPLSGRAGHRDRARGRRPGRARRRPGRARRRRGRLQAPIRGRSRPACRTSCGTRCRTRSSSPPPRRASWRPQRASSGRRGACSTTRRPGLPSCASITSGWGPRTCGSSRRRGARSGRASALRPASIRRATTTSSGRPSSAPCATRCCSRRACSSSGPCSTARARSRR